MTAPHCARFGKASQACKYKSEDAAHAFNLFDIMRSNPEGQPKSEICAKASAGMTETTPLHICGASTSTSEAQAHDLEAGRRSPQTTTITVSNNETWLSQIRQDVDHGATDFNVFLNIIFCLLGIILLMIVYDVSQGKMLALCLQIVLQLLAGGLAVERALWGMEGRCG